jgi:hypothetical protein
MLSIGAPMSALQIYEDLQLWNEVIMCYQSVGRHSQAVKVIQEELEKKGETVNLLCLMGDITQVVL